MRILDSGVLQGQMLRSVADAGFLCHEVLYSQKMQLAAHGHQNSFFALSLDGWYSESACGQEFVCGPRSVVFHPPGEEHAITIRGAVHCFVIEIRTEEIRSRYDAALPRELFHTDGASISILLERLYGEFRVADAASPLAMQGLLLQVLALSSRTDAGGGSAPPWLGRVDDILRERFRSRLSVEEIAMEIGVSPARLSAVFRQAKQRSLAEEQRRLRVELACERLRDRSASLADIAFECGFSDQPHFTRTFKQSMGMTPARYRSIF